MGWIMGNQSGPSRRRMSGKGMREVGGGAKSGRKVGERAVGENGVVAFISCWISMCRTEGEGRRERWI